jgi:hypothetical protein
MTQAVAEIFHELLTSASKFGMSSLISDAINE